MEGILREYACKVTLGTMIRALEMAEREEKPNPHFWHEQFSWAQDHEWLDDWATKNIVQLQRYMWVHGMHMPYGEHGGRCEHIFYAYEQCYGKLSKKRSSVCAGG